MIQYRAKISKLRSDHGPVMFDYGDIRNKKEGLFEHHILARCEGGSDLAVNLVYATRKEHHQLHRIMMKYHIRKGNTEAAKFHRGACYLIRKGQG